MLAKGAKASAGQSVMRAAWRCGGDPRGETAFEGMGRSRRDLFSGPCSGSATSGHHTCRTRRRLHLQRVTLPLWQRLERPSSWNDGRLWCPGARRRDHRMVIQQLEVEQRCHPTRCSRHGGQHTFQINFNKARSLRQSSHTQSGIVSQR